MKQVLFFFLFVYSLMAFPLTPRAQSDPAPLTSNEKKQLIDSINRQLVDFYIFPDVAKKMAGTISRNMDNAAYRSIHSPVEFASRLTRDLISVSNDKHLRVTFDPEWVLESKKTNAPKVDLELVAREMPKWRRGNFGFKEVKILEGNVGYLNLTSFRETEYAGETAVAAMNFFANADALIIDLRNNGGGDSSMVQLVSSYLYDSTPVLLGDSYFREGEKEKHTQDWTLPYVPGKRRLDIDVYILTSLRTFSAAEAFTFGLQNSKRAVVIGEKTGGGAHFVTRKAATDLFSIWIPNGRSIDPITKTDWEGVGVKPDIEVPSGDALFTAQIKALEKLADKNPAAKDGYLWHLATVKARQKPVQIDQSTLEAYAGAYGDPSLSVANGRLYWQRKGGPKYELIAIAPDLFMFDGMSDLKLKILIEGGNVTGVILLFEDGRSTTYIRNKK